MSSDGYIGNLGRQDFDDTFAENAEMTPVRFFDRLLPNGTISLARSKHDPSLLTLALCIILPGGLFILAGLALRRYFKG